MVVRSALKKAVKGTLVSAVAGTITILMILLPLSSASAAPPTTWSKTRLPVTEAPPGTGPLVESNLKDTYFLSDMTGGWAVGSPSYVGANAYHCYHTHDMVTWVPQIIGNDPALLVSEMESVYFRNAELGWICGQMGIVSRCTNSTVPTWNVTRRTTSAEVLQDIFATSDNDVWAVGVTMGNPADPSTYSPLVVKSDNSGLTWHNVDLASISFADTSNGWAVGPAGAIIHTNNSGANWAFQASGTTADLNAVYAVSALEAWAAGANGTILHTADGGTTWSSDYGANAVFSLDVTHTWVGGQSGLMMFYNGTSWAQQNTVTTSNIRAVKFLDASYGWACADNNVTLYTTNGGATWNGGPAVTADLNDIALYNNGANYIIWTCGQAGAFYYTTDAAPGGAPAAWSTASVAPPAQDLKGIDFMDATHGVVAGSAGTMAYTADGGDNWTNSPTVGTTDFTDVTYGHDADSWIATASNGGMWHTRAATSGDWAPLAINDVCNAAGIDYYAGTSGTMLKRDGATWTAQDAGVTDLTSVKYAGAALQFWAAGAGDTVLWSDDGGGTWNSIPTGLGFDWNDMSVVETGGGQFLVTVVADNGNVAYTTMSNPPGGGPVWNSPASVPGGTPDLKSVDFYNEDIGWAVGESGTVWQTLDGGQNWADVQFNDVFSLGADDTYMVGNGGTIVHWDALAQTAELQYNATTWTTENLNAICMANADNGYAVGENGTVIQFSTGTWAAPAQVGTVVHPDLKGIDMRAADGGYAVGSDSGSGYYVQLVGGVWGDAVQIGTVDHPPLSAISLAAADAGYAVGDGGYYVQLTGGAWQEPAQVGGANPDLKGVYVNGTDVYAVGMGGYYATYLAASWTVAQVGGTNPDLYSIDIPTSAHGYAVGGGGGVGYTVPIVSGTFGAPAALGTRELRGVSMYSTEGYGFACGLGRTLASFNVSGTGWQVDSQVLATAGTFNSLRLEDGAQRGWAVGDGGMAYRFNSGLMTATNSNTANNINSVTVPSVGIAYAAAEGATVCKYSGGSWSSFSLGDGNAYLAADSTDDENAIIAGARNTVWQTTDGLAWNNLSGAAATTDDFLALDFANGDNGWFVGESGMFFRYANGQIGEVTSGTTSDLRGISMSGATDGFAVGDARTVLQTTAPDTWNKLSGLSATADVGAISFPNAGRGWFAGESGFVLAYDNGTFNTQSSGTTEMLNGISMVDGGGGVYAGAAVGDNGAVRFTSDSGNNWGGGGGSLPAVDLNGIDMVSPTKAILCGDYDTGNVGTVRLSADGGATWVAPTTPPPGDEDLTGVSFGDAANDHAWIVGTGGVVFTTSDLGDTWAAQTSGTGQDLNSVSAYYDAGSVDYTVFAAGSTRTILRSLDGGANWNTQSGIPRSGALSAASAVDADNFFFAGSITSVQPFEGMVIRTLNGGTTFKAMVGGGVPSLNGISAFSTGAIWAVGDTGYVTFFNGAVWSPQDSHVTDDLSDVKVEFNGANFVGVLAGDNGAVMRSVDASAGDGNWAAPATNLNKNNLSSCCYHWFGLGVEVAYFAGDDGTILGSSDGGVNLQFLKGPSNELNGVSFYDDAHGWACGTRGTILYTADAGSTWNVQDSTTLQDLKAVYAINSTHAIAVGNNDTAVLWDGLVWSAGTTGSGENLYGVAAADDTHVWAVGANGTIRFFDGATWQDQDSGTAQMNAVAVADATHVWAVGNAGTILFYNGATWAAQTSGTTADLLGVSAPDNSNVFVSGKTGLALRSTNGGTDWSELDTGSGADLNSVRMISPQNGWIVGTNDMGTEEAEVLYTNTGGASWTSGTSSTGIARSLNAVTAVHNGTTNNFDFYSAGDWGLIQKISNADAVPAITPPLNPTVGTVVPPTTVTITGTGFGVDQATVDGHVFFNGGIEGTVAPGDWTDTQIQVTVPSGAYGWQADVTVRTDGGQSNGAPFTVTPSIDGATSPVTGGDTVTITGEGFGTDPGADHRADDDHHITIGGTRIPNASVGSWGNTQIELDLPDNIDPGTAVPVRVTAENAANESAPFNITVQPSVNSFGSNTARPGDTVTVNGTNFGTVPPGSRNTAGDHVSMNTSDGSQHVGDNGTLEPATWTPTSITFVVPYEYTPPAFIPRTGNVSVTAASEGSNNLSLTILPRADTLSAPAAVAGDPITIDGAAFGDAPGQVTFNGTAATGYTGWQDNQITATVPNAAVTSGDVVVTTADGASLPLPFDLTPQLDTISTDSGRVGDQLVLQGTGFGSPQGLANVSVGGLDWDDVTAWNTTSITVSVPTDAISGDVVVTTQGGATPAGMGYTVMPKITGLNPDKGIPGQTIVTVSGYTFGATQGGSKVTFNGRSAGAALSWSPMAIEVRVPVGTTSGNVVVTTADGASNAMPFSVGPYINSITPDQSPPTGQVTIAGENFKAAQGTSKVLFGGVDAGAADSWSDTSIKVKVPYGAETGTVTVTTAEGASNAFPFTIGLSKTYYFAEGTTRANFETWLCLMNPNDTPANIQVLYMLGDGTTKHFEASIPKTSRMTLYVADVVGLEKDVSTKVTSNIPIVAERPMYFNYGGVWTGGHDVIGAIAPAQDWYFAEGNTRDGFEEWICLQNPNAQATNVDITYMLQGGQNQVQSIEIPPTSRRTISVNAFLGPNKDCSAKVHADMGIIAERPMYFVYKPDVLNWTGGHDVIGANAPGKEWYFAEGTTRDGFDEWLCLQNPGATAATVNISYMLATGQTLTQIVSVDPHARKTLDVVAFIGRGQDVSMHVSSSEPIVAERPMYFDYVGLTGGSDVIGSTCSAKNWYFAEGATQNGFQEWMSIQNPGDTAATVMITFMLGTGQTMEKAITVDPHSRATVDVNSEVGWGKDVSTKVTTMEKVIIERPMYFNDHGWTGGHDVVGFHY